MLAKWTDLSLQRIKFIENSLQSGLERLYQEGLQTKNVEVITTCLRTYSAIERASEAENIFRTTVVHPFMAKVPRPIFPLSTPLI